MLFIYYSLYHRYNSIIYTYILFRKIYIIVIMASMKRDRPVIISTQYFWKNNNKSLFPYVLILLCTHVFFSSHVERVDKVYNLDRKLQTHSNKWPEKVKHNTHSTKWLNEPECTLN